MNKATRVKLKFAFANPRALFSTRLKDYKKKLDFSILPQYENSVA